MSSNPHRIRFADHFMECPYDPSHPLIAPRITQNEELWLAEGQSPYAAPPRHVTTTLQPQFYQPAPPGTAPTTIWGYAAQPPTPHISPVALPAIPGGLQTGHGAVLAHSNRFINRGLSHSAAASPAQGMGAMLPASAAAHINSPATSQTSVGHPPAHINDTPSPASVGAPDLDGLHPGLHAFPLLWDVKRSPRLPLGALYGSDEYAFANAAKGCALRFYAGPDFMEEMRVGSEHREHPLQLRDVFTAILQYLWKERDDSAILPYHPFYQEALRARNSRRDSVWRSADFWPGTALYFRGLRAVHSSAAGVPVYVVLLDGNLPQGQPAAAPLRA
ncbi:hypothetical protein ACG7TL_008935 [Trametes sanguinea]